MINNYYFAATRLERAINAGDEFDIKDLRELIDYAKSAPRITVEAIGLFTAVEWKHRFMVYNGGSSCHCGWPIPDPKNKLTLDQEEDIHRIHQVTEILTALVQEGKIDEQ